MRRSPCPVCAKQVGLTKTQRLRKHGPRRNLVCSGSGRLDSSGADALASAREDLTRETEMMRQALAAFGDFLSCYTEQVTKPRASV